MTLASASPRPLGTRAVYEPGRCTFQDGTLRQVLDLGRLPLANALLRSASQATETFPLRLGCCSGCGHLQLMDPVPAARLFSKGYPFRTGASAPACEHFRGLADLIADASALGCVYDIGCADGILLGYLRAAGVKAVGVDPSSAAHGVPSPVEPLFFDEDAAEYLAGKHGRASVVVLCNVLAHNPVPQSLISAAHSLLLPDGLLVIEAPERPASPEGFPYDMVYHEHMHLFSAATLVRLIVPGFLIERLERIPVHGGSLRLWARREPAVPRTWDDATRQELRNTGRDWSGLQNWVDEHARRLRQECDSAPYPLVVYGVPAKATVLLNYAGVRPAFAVDSTPAKQGCYIPGVGTPILSPSELLRRKPGALLLAAWNYAEQILAREQALGPWIIPFGPFATV